MITTRSATELDVYIHKLSDRESEERDKLTKRYTGRDDKEVEAYERGFADGYQAGSQDGWAKGFDAGLRQAAEEKQEQEEKGGDS